MKPGGKHGLEGSIEAVARGGSPDEAPEAPAAEPPEETAPPVEAQADPAASTVEEPNPQAAADSEPEPADGIDRAGVQELIDAALAAQKPAAVVSPLQGASAAGSASQWYAEGSTDDAFREGYEKEFGLAGYTSGPDVMPAYTGTGR